MKRNHFLCRITYGLILLCLYPLTLKASNDYVIDGIKYRTYSGFNTAEVIRDYNAAGGYKGDITIAETITAGGLQFKVTGIAEDAFYECHELFSVTMPVTIETIEEGNFVYCDKLTALNIADRNKIFKSIDGVLYDKDVTTLLCYPEGRSGDYIVPNTVKSFDITSYKNKVVLTNITSLTIGASLGVTDFTDCPNLMSINVVPENITYSSINGILYNKAQDELMRMPPKYPDNISFPADLKTIGENAFYGCTGIERLCIPENVELISTSAFQNCTGLIEVSIPNSVKGIGKYAFRNCCGLTSLTIPASVKSLGEHAFEGCGLSVLILYCTHNGSYASNTFYRYVLDGVGSPVIFALETELNDIRQWKKDANLKSLNRPENLDIVPYLRGGKISIKPNDDYKLNKLYYGETELFPDVNGEYWVKGLPTGTTSTLTANIEYLGQEIVMYPYVTTKYMTITPNVKTTQTTIQLGQISATEDETVDIRRKYYNIDYIEYQEIDTIKGLKPNTLISIWCYACVEYEDGSGDRSSSFSCSTLGLNPTLEETLVAPTTILCQIHTDEGDAHIDTEKITIRLNDTDSVIIGNQLILTSLEPERSYYFNYEVTTKEGSKDAYVFQARTNAIEFNSLTPKISNKGEAIVAATTNISDAEENAGFEWRKVDAPDIVPSNSAKAVIYEGRLEGLIKNLDETTYYQVRPYYESAAGNKYYGDWIGFDPSDFSYFEPTVHTYANAVVTEGTATISGYALGGSDEIEEQGFEYWTIGISQTQRVPSTDVQTVKANGQRMTIELTGLTAGTTYGYRAFVKTTKGMFYGEERQFSTLVSSGIETPAIASPTKTIVGYYSLQGKKQNGMQRGINIVRYSDGTTKKVMVR